MPIQSKKIFSSIDCYERRSGILIPISIKNKLTPLPVQEEPCEIYGIIKNICLYCVCMYSIEPDEDEDVR